MATMNELLTTAIQDTRLSHDAIRLLCHFVNKWHECERPGTLSDVVAQHDDPVATIKALDELVATGHVSFAIATGQDGPGYVWEVLGL
jgi:hypothetical protein